MKNKIIALAIVSISTFGLNAMAASSYDGPRSDLFLSRIQERNENKQNSSVVEVSGELKCLNKDHMVSGSCQMALTDKDNETFLIEANEELLKAHCSEHKDISVKIFGERSNLNEGPTSITVKKFEVMRSIASAREVTKANNDQNTKSEWRGRILEGVGRL